MTVLRIIDTTGAPGYGVCAIGERNTACGSSSSGKPLKSRLSIIACHCFRDAATLWFRFSSDIFNSCFLFLWCESAGR
ncbi:hypothetical protein D3C86_1647220 [compost metagenome]